MFDLREIGESARPLTFNWHFAIPNNNLRSQAISYFLLYLISGVNLLEREQSRTQKATGKPSRSLENCDDQFVQEMNEGTNAKNNFKR
jgi:hypothetical protein